MKILTVDVIRENPWHVVTHALPANPTPFFIGMAYKAADYCRQSETMIGHAVFKGSDDSQVEAARYCPDECIRRMRAANERINDLLRHCPVSDGRFVLTI